jgi:hypothetical protein
VEIDGINVTRLCSEIGQRAEGDPFCLDEGRIVESILSGSFRVTDIRPLPMREFELLLDAGLWFTESPLCAPLGTNGAAALRLSLTHGFHKLFHSTEPIHYDIYVTQREVFTVKVTE